MSLARVSRVLQPIRSIRPVATRTLATVAATHPSQTQQQGQSQSQAQQSSDVSVPRHEDRGMTRRRERDRGDVFSELERDMNQMMHSFMSPFVSAWSPFRHLSPFADNWGMSRRRGLMDFDQLLNRTVNINLEEKEQEYVMTIQAPGLKKEELNINVEDGMLQISGSHEERHEGRRGATTTSSVSFQRSMTLPDDINQDGIKAEYDDKGNLCRVHLPKVPETERKQRGKIEIQSAPSS